MNALDNGIPANMVGLIYTSNYIQHLVQVSVRKKFCYFVSVLRWKRLNKKKKIIKIQIILMRTCLISYYHYAKELLEKSLMENFIFMQWWHIIFKL